ncbi:MAG TPA: glycosyltransferase family 1 protein [Desulfonatronum sp.]|nr:glycosyltransferase family 1 protein [Desulfonatronum sp.]
MNTYIFLPPLAKMTGGLAVLVQTARHLHASGFPIRLVIRETGRPALSSALQPLALAWDDLELGGKDLWLVPEGWINALTPGLKAGARCMVYVQNWAYLFSSLSKDLSWHDLPVSFLAVSRPVAWFIQQTLGRKCPVLPPGIDRVVFSKPESKPLKPLQVAFMPRKNKALANLIRSIWEARNPGQVDKGQLAWMEIHGQDQSGVARMMQEAHFFLATGFPEGCPLPPLEAMACGCLPLGFTGFGGWEYMTQIRPDAWRPWWTVPENPWGGNGFWAPDADALAVALALEDAVRLAIHSGPELQAALDAGQQTADAFSLERQREKIVSLWSHWSTGG